MQTLVNKTHTSLWKIIIAYTKKPPLEFHQAYLSRFFNWKKQCKIQLLPEKADDGVEALVL